MKLILDDRVGQFRKLFTKPYPCKEDEVASKKISPSGLGCDVAVAFKLTGVPMLPEERSFESDGYASSGSDRHKNIQEFLRSQPEIEWVDVERYVKEHDLPFDVYYEYGIEEKAEKYKLTCQQVCELVGSYERTLVHKNGLMSFKLDGLIKFRDEYYIVEIKTVGSSKFKKAPLQEHQPQGITYALQLKIPRIIWIYENREDFKHSIAFQLVLPEEIENMRDRLNNIVKNKDTPEKLERSSDCKYCRYRKHCDEVFDGSKSIF